MIEAMACGTPVLAFRCGSVPEVIEDGVTGKVVDSEDEAVAVLPEILSYDRRAVRQRFEDRFTSTRMAKDYVSTYHRLLKNRSSGAPGARIGNRFLVQQLAQRLRRSSGRTICPFAAAAIGALHYHYQFPRQSDGSTVFFWELSVAILSQDGRLTRAMFILLISARSSPTSYYPNQTLLLDNLMRAGQCRGSHLPLPLAPHRPSRPLRRLLAERRVERIDERFGGRGHRGLLPCVHRRRWNDPFPELRAEGPGATAMAMRSVGRSPPLNRPD